MIFCNCPVKTTHPLQNTPVTRVSFAYNLENDVTEVVNNLLASWRVVTQLYQAVLAFSHVQAGSKALLQSYLSS